MNVAIIPARGGSKGIPRKNVRDLCGRPLIAWSILQAQASKAVDRVYVTTDDDEIAEVAITYGAHVHWRSEASATDTAASEIALRECLSAVEDPVEAVVFLQATSPIRQSHDIDLAVMALLSSRADSVFSAREVEGYTWRWCGNVLSPQYSSRIPRQQRSVKTLEENGSIYVMRPEILQAGNRLGGQVRPYIMHPLDSFQLDEEQDWPMMERLMEVRLELTGRNSHQDRVVPQQPICCHGNN